MAESALAEDGRYEHVKVLGKGSFGFVCQARSLQTQELVAIKFLPRSEVNKYVEAEIVNHSLMRHPHVIQFREVFLTSAFICISMEYAGMGSLHAYVRQQGHLKEAVARWFFQQLILAVDYCHRKGVANRDIKLENTLLQSVPRLPLPLMKVCDFGYSKQENKSAAKSKVGTLSYMAPEVLLSVTRDGRYDGKVADIWSCGVMLYVMLTGRYPFDSPNKTGYISTPNDFIIMLEQMVACKYVIPDDLGISEDCTDLLRRMLLPEPHRRIRIDAILAHPWFNTNLPPEAASMNARYLELPQLPGVPPPADIRDMLAACVRDSGGGGSSGGRGGNASTSASSSRPSGGGGGGADRSGRGSGRSSARGGKQETNDNGGLADGQGVEGSGMRETDTLLMPPRGLQQQQQQQQDEQAQRSEAMQMSGMLDDSMRQVPAAAAVQLQPQHGMLPGQGGEADDAMEADAAALSCDRPSGHQMSSQLQAYVDASKASWS